MPKILVIDDAEMARTTIRRILENDGYEVFEAHNGKKGLQMVECCAPDAVVTDILMPDMEGLETIRQLVKTKPDLPVIAVTGASHSPYLNMAIKFGAKCGLHKPFKQAELLSAVREAVSDAHPQNT